MATDEELTGDGGPPAPHVQARKARAARRGGTLRNVVRIDGAFDRRYGRGAQGWPIGVPPLAEGAHAHAVSRASKEWFDMRFTSKVAA